MRLPPVVLAVVALCALQGAGSVEAAQPVGQIAFIAYHGLSAGLYVMSPDGSGLRQLRGADPDAGTNSGPTWSPDGTQLAYICDDFQLCVINSNGSDRRVLTSSTSWPDQWDFASAPAWSPQGNQIAYYDVASGRGKNTVIKSIGVADAVSRTVFAPSRSEGDASDPQWNPDGSRLSFTVLLTVAGNDVYRLFSVSSGGGQPHQLGQGIEWAWSADGRHIAILGANLPTAPRYENLALADAAGRASRPVDTVSVTENSPTFSPDSGWLAYVGLRNGNTGIYRLQLPESGAAAVPIPTPGLEVASVSWGPPPSSLPISPQPSATAVPASERPAPTSSEARMLSTYFLVESEVDDVLYTPETAPLAIARATAVVRALSVFHPSTPNGQKVLALARVQGQAAVLDAKALVKYRSLEARGAVSESEAQLAAVQQYLEWYQSAGDATFTAIRSFL